MKHKVLVSTFLSAYRNAMMAMCKKYNCVYDAEAVEKLEIECNLKHIADFQGETVKNYLEFSSEQHYLMFLMRWM